jgi:hypothetical protein
MIDMVKEDLTQEKFVIEKMQLGDGFKSAEVKPVKKLFMAADVIGIINPVQGLASHLFYLPDRITESHFIKTDG